MSICITQHIIHLYLQYNPFAVFYNADFLQAHFSAAQQRICFALFLVLCFFYKFIMNHEQPTCQGKMLSRIFYRCILFSLLLSFISCLICILVFNRKSRISYLAWSTFSLHAFTCHFHHPFSHVISLIFLLTHTHK